MVVHSAVDGRFASLLVALGCNLVVSSMNSLVYAQFSASPCAKDCHSVAAEMHNIFAKSVVSTESSHERLSPWPESHSSRNCAFRQRTTSFVLAMERERESQSQDCDSLWHTERC